jgi:hypothetical protein
VAQGIGPEFKSQYCKQKQKETNKPYEIGIIISSILHMSALKAREKQTQG